MTQEWQQLQRHHRRTHRYSFALPFTEDHAAALVHKLQLQPWRALYMAYVLINTLLTQPSPELRGAVKEQLQLLQALLGRDAGVVLQL